MSRKAQQRTPQSTSFALAARTMDKAGTALGAVAKARNREELLTLAALSALTMLAALKRWYQLREEEV